MLAFDERRRGADDQTKANLQTRGDNPCAYVGHFARSGEFADVPFQIGPDGLTGLIDKKILIRAYGPEADQRDAIKVHLDGLDIEALEALAGQLQ